MKLIVTQTLIHLLKLDSEFETDCDSEIEALTEALSELETDCDAEIDSLY
ncbi:MAG: hypothetical protein ACLRSA_03330 [Streptococcus salivarius]